MNIPTFVKSRMETNTQSGKKPKEARYLGLVFVLIIVVTVFVVKFKQSEKQPISRFPGSDESLTRVLARSKISFPAVVSSKAVNPNQLPFFLKNLIGDDADYNSVESLQYSKSNGYRIDVDVNKPLTESYRGFTIFLNQNSWSIEFGSRGNMNAVLEAMNATGKIRIVQRLIDQNKYNLVIEYTSGN